MDKQEPVLFRHGLVSPTCKLETGAKIKFQAHHYETSSKSIINQIRNSSLFNVTIFEVGGNPMEKARNSVRKETALKTEIEELKAKLAAAEEAPKPVRRKRKKKEEEKTDGDG